MTREEYILNELEKKVTVQNTVGVMAFIRQMVNRDWFIFETYGYFQYSNEEIMEEAISKIEAGRI